MNSPYNVLFQEITKRPHGTNGHETLLITSPFFPLKMRQRTCSLLFGFLTILSMKNTYTLSYKTKTLQINFYFLLFTNIQTWFCESYLSSKTPIWIFVDEQFLLPQHWWSKWEHFQLIHRPSNFQTQNRCHHIWYSDLVSKYNI